jgi:hypothetical protein
MSTKPDQAQTGSLDQSKTKPNDYVQRRVYPVADFVRLALRSGSPNDHFHAATHRAEHKRTLPITCPTCPRTGSMVVVKSITVMTVMCASYGHTWATEVDALPPNIQLKVHAILREQR